MTAPYDWSLEEPELPDELNAVPDRTWAEAMTLRLQVRADVAAARQRLGLTHEDR